MHKIQVNQLDTASQAIKWCMKHVNKGNWNVTPNWPSAGFVFEFNQQKDASWFGLHWVR